MASSKDLAVKPRHPLNAARSAATGAFTGLVFFSLCWVATALPLGSVSHMYVQLFTTAAVDSVAALAEGSVWSVVFGLIAGALIAAFYNMLRFLDRY